MAVAIPSVNIPTSEIAYPVDAEYYPRVAVYDAPYSDGDCPIWTGILALYEIDGERYWKNESGEVLIYSERVTIELPLVEGNQYEVRIYESNQKVIQLT